MDKRLKYGILWFYNKNEIPPVKLGLVSQNKVYHIYPTQQSVKNGPPNRVPSRITNYHCQSAAKCDTCLYCFSDSFSFLFIHVYVSSPKFRFIELTRAKYTTNANDIQPSFIGVDSTGKQGTGIYPAQLVGGWRPPSPRWSARLPSGSTTIGPWQVVSKCALSKNSDMAHYPRFLIIRGNS